MPACAQIDGILDLKDGKFGRDEAGGIKALIAGVAMAHRRDEERLTRGGAIFDDPNFQTRAYERRIAYGQSKTANALFAVNLDAIGKPHGVGAFSVHPGGVITDLTRYTSADEIRASGFIDEQGRPIIDPARNM